MAEPTGKEMLYYGDVGFLYLYDVQYDPDDRAYCNPLPDGRVQFRVHTEHGFGEARLVYNDGEVHGTPMTRVAHGVRYDYWELCIEPQSPQIRYTFAFKRERPTGKSFYFGPRGLTHAAEKQFMLNLDEASPLLTPDWAKGAVIYQIFPERFANGDDRVTPEGARPWGSDPKWLEFQGGDLRGITQNLDHIQALGVEVLYLNPIMTSPSNHKYDTIDYYHVDSAFGGDEALHELVAALHERGMKIILDASFNHCYPRFFAFADLVEKGEASTYKDWFTIHEFPVQVKRRPHLISEEERSLPYFETKQKWFEHFSRNSGVPIQIAEDDGPIIDPSYMAWYGVLDMPKINHQNRETSDYFLDVAAHWLREFDVDGWRMDVAQFVDDRFWREFREACKAVKPDCYLLCEIWGDTSEWLQGDMFDATMNYLFRDLCLSYFARSEIGAEELAEGLIRLKYHYAPQVTAVQQNLLSSHDVARFLNLCGEDKQRLRLATFFQLMMPGAPSIYYGDEVGMSGGHDPDNRRAFPWHKPESWDGDLFDFMSGLIALRQSHPALKIGDWRWLGGCEDVFFFARSHEGRDVVVFVNRGDVATDLLEIDVAELKGRQPEILWGAGHIELNNGRLQVSAVPAWSGLVVALE